MAEENIYSKTRLIARQLCDIMQQQELQDIGELKDWLEHNSIAPEVLRMLMNGTELSKEIEFYRRQDKETALRIFREKIRYHRRRRIIKRISRAAAIIVILLAFTILYNRFPESEKPQPMVSVVPVTPSPIIKTPDGICYNLSKITTDTSQPASNLNIAYKNNNEIRYTYQTDTKHLKESELYNQLIIPRQCNYQVTLCDGTVIRLNAESHLEYPTHFPRHERRVRLTGEAYFEVKHDDRPFIVEINEANIRVYGTRFNINAYEKENIETVLVEGKIGISIPNITHREQILRPNQLSRINLSSGEQEIRDVDIQKFIAWTTGFLRYDHDPLEKLIKDLSRWYGIEFDFNNNELKDIRISASINKDTPLQEVLTMIRTTAKIKFQLIERRYMITY